VVVIELVVVIIYFSVGYSSRICSSISSGSNSSNNRGL